MEEKGIVQFTNFNQESGTILNIWMEACGVSRKKIFEEFNQSPNLEKRVGFKSFQQWTSAGESAKKISGNSKEEVGQRFVEIVRWFFREHSHRNHGFMTTDDLRKMMSIYEDIPALYHLQLQRILHDLEIFNKEKKPELPLNLNWKKQLLEQPLCAFVMDRYWCIHATTNYEMAFAGIGEEDLKNWGAWHRLTASIHNVPKFVAGSPMHQTRGPYAREYYVNQFSRFRRSTADLIENNDSRILTLLELLNESLDFSRLWELSIVKEVDLKNNHIGFPAPFFRKDGALIWMLELGVEISNTEGLHLIHWTPIDHDSNLYMADFYKSVGESRKYSRTCYFLEDYVHYFTAKERQVFGY